MVQRIQQQYPRDLKSKQQSFYEYVVENESDYIMNEQNYDKMRDSLISIASELFRFKQVFGKAISKLELDEQNKYNSQFAWFSKKVLKALDEANLKIVDVAGQLYDPGMAVTPLNIEDFETDDVLCVVQMMEPIIMNGDNVVKTGTVILGRIDKWNIT